MHSRGKRVLLGVVLPSLLSQAAWAQGTPPSLDSVGAPLPKDIKDYLRDGINTLFFCAYNLPESNQLIPCMHCFVDIEIALQNDLIRLGPPSVPGNEYGMATTADLCDDGIADLNGTDYYTDGSPQAIRIEPSVLSTLPPTVLAAMLMHECSHFDDVFEWVQPNDTPEDPCLYWCEEAFGNSKEAAFLDLLFGYPGRSCFQYGDPSYYWIQQRYLKASEAVGVYLDLVMDNDCPECPEAPLNH